MIIRIYNQLHYRDVVKFGLLLLSVLMVGCSSGGGGDGGSSGKAGFSLSANSLEFSAVIGGTTDPAPKAIAATVFADSGIVKYSFRISGAAIDHISYKFSSTTTDITVYPTNLYTLGAGTHTGSLSIYGCLDINCTKYSSPTPEVVNVTYTITGLVSTIDKLDLSAVVTAASTPVQATLSHTQGSGAWSASVSYNGANTGWLMMNTMGGSTLPVMVEFTASAMLTPGTYEANVMVTSGTSTLKIPVIYTVRYALSPTPVSLMTYSLGNNAAPADYSQSLSPGAYPGVTWAASTDVNWIQLSPDTGGDSDTISVSLTKAETDALANGRHTAFIKLVPSIGSTHFITVTLDIARTQVNSVNPYVATSGTQADVIIRGELFDQTTIQNVIFGSNSAISYTYVSDREIRATYPSLPAGNYAVNLELPWGTNHTLANLVVVDAPNYSAQTIDYPNTDAKTVMNLMYYAERQALIVAVAYPSQGADGELLRYPYTAGAWATTPDSVSVPALQDAGISLTGKLVVAISDNAITPIDPGTLLAGTPISAPFDPIYVFQHLAFSNDGYALISTGIKGSGSTSLYRYQADDLSNGVAIGSFDFAVLGASADGSRVTIRQSLDFPAEVVQYNASTGSFDNTPITLGLLKYGPVMDRAATRFILGRTNVYGANYIQQGSLPSAVPVVMSPDGTKAYCFVGGTTLRTYDLAASPVAGLFPEIGTGTTLPGDPGADAKIIISPDGGTLFIAGADGIVVVPTP